MINTILIPNKEKLLTGRDIKINEFYKSNEGILYYVSRFYKDNQKDEFKIFYTVSEINYNNYNVMLSNKEAVANYLNDHKAKPVNILIKEVE